MERSAWDLKRELMVGGMGSMLDYGIVRLVKGVWWEGEGGSKVLLSDRDAFIRTSESILEDRVHSNFMNA